jgi:hypothetical protein
MLKRIPLNQLRVGMFINDMEFTTELDAARFRPFMVSKGDDVRRLAAGHVRSVVIDITKGIDVAGAPSRDASTSFEAQLLNVYSKAEISSARQSIQDVGPHLRHVLEDARVKRLFRRRGSKQCLGAHHVGDARQRRRADSCCQAEGEG